VTDPDHALEQARANAASMRASGAYGEDTERAAPPSESHSNLIEWAVIDPDLSNVRSLRRYGAPLTFLKRGLLRLLAQYHAELTAEQSRFNVKLVEELRRLEQRLDALEQKLEHRSS
jgi:hypothetical protein